MKENRKGFIAFCIATICAVLIFVGVNIMMCYTVSYKQTVHELASRAEAHLITYNQLQSLVEIQDNKLDSIALPVAAGCSMSFLVMVVCAIISFVAYYKSSPKYAYYSMAVCISLILLCIVEIGVLFVLS